MTMLPVACLALSIAALLLGVTLIRRAWTPDVAYMGAACGVLGMVGLLITIVGICMRL